MTEIDLLMLKKAVNRLFDHLILTLEINKIEMTHEFYWKLGDKQKFDMMKKPEVSFVGNLTDDWEFAQNILNEHERPIVYQFCQLSPLIDYIGSVVGLEFSKDGG